MEKLKILADWRVSKLPQLVDIIKEVQEVHDNQLLDIRDVLHGRGNFELVESFQHLSIFHSAWLAMTKEQRAKSFVKFFKDQNQSNFNHQRMIFRQFQQLTRLPKKPWSNQTC